ncbi:E3 SUMO-protein ligase ZBED1-like [Dysidea avara]|uniref:E3 SUMO-protein ligase ZBED1-like n=1 Tax=Dysidea avara TaxID=196820 RepID=UPI003317DB4E
MELVARKNATSPVWTYFGLEKESDGRIKSEDVAVCRKCYQRVRAKGGNTSNLLSHLRIHHPTIHGLVMTAIKTKNRRKEDLEKRQQPSIASSMKKVQQYDRTTRKWREITTAVTYCLAKDSLPIYTVDKVGFRNMVEKMDPQYDFPSSKYFSKTSIPALYEDTRQKLQLDLQEQAKAFSATADMWTSVTGEPYLSYTIHYINDEWELKTKCLHTLYFPADHTGQNIADALKDTLSHWGLDAANQVCITTDNGSNILCAIRSHLAWPYLSCFGHNLHLAIGNSIKDDSRVQRALSICRKIVTSFSHSWKKKRDLSEAQATLEFPQHSLVSDCVTRWGSQQLMVGRILEQESAIRQVLASDRRCSHLLPTWQDIEVLQSIHAVLSPLAEFTDTLSGEERVTASAIKPLLDLLQRKTLATSPADTTLVTDIKERIINYLMTKYDQSDFDKLINVSSFLDPRVKTKHLKDQDVIKQRVIEEGTELIESGAGVDDHSVVVVSGDEPSTSSGGVGCPPNKRRKLSSLLREATSTVCSTAGTVTPGEEQTAEDKMRNEVEEYLKISTIDPEVNPLKWWKIHVTDFPVISKLARKYLCVCASSSPSERVFSLSGHIVSKKRNVLKPHKVNMLVFLAKNL